MRHASFTVLPGKLWRCFSLTLVFLVPLVVCLVVSWMAAQRLTQAQADAKAAMARNQIGHILNEAWQAVDMMLPLLRGTCAEARPVLVRTLNTKPYFRSLLLLQGQQPYCATNLVVARANTPSWRWEAPPGRWLRLVDGMPFMRERPALLVGASGHGGRRAVAVVDGQYLQEMLDSVAALGGHRVEFKMQGGGNLLSRPAVAGGDEGVMAREAFTSAGVPVSIEVMLPESEVIKEWTRILIGFLPLALLVSCLMVWALRHLQLQQTSVQDQIRRAMRAGEFHMEYQPIYSSKSGRCEGAEALMRWRHPGAGAISPEVFIAAAEAEGAIVPLTRHALGLIAQDLPQMNLPAGFHLSVNLAAEHLLHREFVSDVAAFAARIAPWSPHLVLELTERSLVEDAAQALSNIRAVRTSGVSIAIDDFGSGYCSLAYLQQFPVDYLKVDKTFIVGIENAQQESPILDMILALARRLELEVVAEGVSTRGQLDYLLARDVAYVQGFLVAEPMRAQVFADWYREQVSLS
ncbi:EAL domain-containing protein [Bordetella avium]|uniref:EAL domain-containing protein n=1 Tax=Bordetella avium TaxID=521 RepID=UPI0003181503|nr:cyclic diguanylate phosphodiesterase [Bordetella avium]AZY49218.1 cyclic diguanylate phosphodiesterase [Bordetella avium]AZY52574.1 cyclic diguanylate phosphodiesterase [Bordetella avium]RIQ12698.1 cyclic diguanylate phosphodiesterase [Bordetella avium]RIQ19264.1 cyclic diguanylate phosphodiesterase [Bordetella avium]RIQ33432.1 cyclic diguanylate phosphodiesterase [Bordetella avium]